MANAKRDFINAIILLAFSGFAYFGSTQIPIQGLGKTEADFFPTIVISVLAILSICLLIISMYRMTKEKRMEKVAIRKVIKRNKKVVATFGLFAGYVFFFHILDILLHLYYS